MYQSAKEVAKRGAAKVTVGTGLLLTSLAALADDPATPPDFFSGISTVALVTGAAAVLTVGVLLALAFKGQGVAKKSVNRI